MTSARDLFPRTRYTRWQKFEQVLLRIANDFPDEACRPYRRARTNHVTGPRTMRDYHLSEAMVLALSESIGPKPMPKWQHGSSSAYNNFCRCAVCVQAERNRRAAKQAESSRVHRPRRSPFNLLAGSCSRCHALISTSIDLITEPQAGFSSCCVTCREGFNRKRNARSRDTASHHCQEWTGPELEVAAREDLTESEVAHMLGRTVAAVQSARRDLRVDPRKARLAGRPGIA